MSTAIAPPPAPPDLVGTGEKMREVLELVAALAETNSTVLITGESGTGKQTVARAIHAASTRRAAPFATVNCAALPEHLLESELFGIWKCGYARPSGRARPGTFEKARGGTVFLGAIEELSPRVQVLLLRFLQTRQFQRLGEPEWIDSDVRVIASTYCDLDSRVREGKFREDLFYRLNVIRIDLPPLRERREDIAPLAARFMDRFGDPQSRRRAISQTATQALVEYAWPGNVRQLENVIERVCLLAGAGLIQYEHLPPEVEAG